eukprot:scaffold11292_cov116-Cylindrotheca_fusiformis.AAC.2
MSSSKLHDYSSTEPRSIDLTDKKPSRKLTEILSRTTGTATLGDKPSKEALSVLSKSGDPRLRFEYIGRFPFPLVAPLLQSRKVGVDSEASSLPKILMVAEKPSIALAISDALCGPRGHRKRRGISRALPVYEFSSTAFQPLQESSDGPVKCLVRVTSVVGHIFSLGFDTQNQTKSDPADFFHLPIVKQEESTTSKLRVLDHLRALSADADHLVLWLDCDPEGENIAHEVIAVTRRAFDTKNSANDDRIHRARFSAISPKSLRDAFASLEKPDAALSRSVDARQELDLRIGVALTRLLTWKCVRVARNRFSPTTRVISYGPCQTPALSFCVDRAREIQQFKSSKFWTPKIEISVDGATDEGTPLIWKHNDDSVAQLGESATSDKFLVEKIVEVASSPNASAVVNDVNEDPLVVAPPFGLNTVALLEAGSKAMGMSPKQVMNVAEKLYSAGFISYPRTETTRYDPNGFDVRSVLRQHAKHEAWGRSATYLLRTKYAKSGRPPLRGRDVGDHPPITPLRASTKADVGGGAAWRVYEFVVRNFLGSLHNELQATRRVATLNIDATMQNSKSKVDDAEFQLKFVLVNSLGFSDVCPWVLRDIGATRQKSHRDQKGQLSLEVGQRFSIFKSTVEEGETRPPRFLQEHELILLMDKNRIGTDASMAVHVSNIIDRGYVILCDETGVPLRQGLPRRPGQKPMPRQTGRYMVPTPLGMNLINLFEDKTNDVSPALLAKPIIRKKMENEVKQIATGSFDKDKCVQSNLDWFEARYQEFAHSLSRERVSDFAKSLSPTEDSLKDWRRYGVFLPKPSSPARAQATGHAKGRHRARTTHVGGKSGNGELKSRSSRWKGSRGTSNGSNVKK